MAIWLKVTRVSDSFLSTLLTLLTLIIHSYLPYYLSKLQPDSRKLIFRKLLTIEFIFSIPSVWPIKRDWIELQLFASTDIVISSLIQRDNGFGGGVCTACAPTSLNLLLVFYRQHLKRPSIDVQYIMQFQLHVLIPECQAMETEAEMTLYTLNR